MGDVSVGDKPAVNANVLMEILGSSESVQARIKQFDDAKKAAEDALANLQLGTEVKAARDEAAKLHQAARDIAAKAKGDAEAAAKAVSDAIAKAAAIVQGANDERDAILKAVAADRAAVDALAQKSAAFFKKRQADVDATAAAAEEARLANEQALREAQDAKAAADAKTQAAAKAEAGFKAATEQLQAHLASLTAPKDGA